jgi:hypothetical protein
MGDPATLASFINYAKTNYPADRYILSMPNHGGGYRDADGIRGISYDYESGNHLNIRNLGATLDASGVHFDLAYLDACLMDMVEVGYDLRNSVNVMVASEEITYGGGTTPYTNLVNWLKANPTASAADFGVQIVDGYMGNCGPNSNQEMASVDLTKMAAVATNMDNLGDLLRAKMPGWQADILTASGATERYADADFADLIDFADKLDGKITDAQLQVATGSVRTSVNDAVLYEVHKGAGVAGSHGLATWIFGGSGLSGSYFADRFNEHRTLAFATATSWDEFNLDLMKSPTTLAALTATPASPYVSKTFTLGGTLTSEGNPVVGKTVYLQEWNGASWTGIGTMAITGGGGAFVFVTTENAAGTYTYRAHFPGSDDIATLYFASDSDPLDVTVVKIPTVISALTADPASPMALHDFTLSGTMTSDDGPVAGETVSLQKKDGASWTDTGLTDETDAGGAFSFSTKEDVAGDYWYRAHFPEGAVYLGSDSPSLDVTVLKIPTVLSMPVPSSETPLINTPFTLAGTLSAEGAGLAGKTVKLWTSTDSGATWTDTAQTALTLNPDGSYTFTITETVAGYRSYKVTFGPDDAYADSESAVVTVRINRAPDVSLAQAKVGSLWSPNHEVVMESVTGVFDPDGDAFTITFTAISSDEATATNKGAGGPKAPDAFILGFNSAQVRSERSGTSDGRVYALSFIADDGFGGVTLGSVKVYVPLDKKKPCIDSGQLYDATAIN